MGLNQNLKRAPISAGGQFTRTGFAAVLGAVLARLIINKNPDLAGMGLEEAVVGGTVVALTSLGNIARNLESKLGSLF